MIFLISFLSSHALTHSDKQAKSLLESPDKMWAMFRVEARVNMYISVEVCESGRVWGLWWEVKGLRPLYTTPCYHGNSHMTMLVVSKSWHAFVWLPWQQYCSTRACRCQCENVWHCEGVYGVRVCSQESVWGKHDHRTISETSSKLICSSKKLYQMVILSICVYIKLIIIKTRIKELNIDGYFKY